MRFRRDLTESCRDKLSCQKRGEGRDGAVASKRKIGDQQKGVGRGTVMGRGGSRGRKKGEGVAVASRSGRRWLEVGARGCVERWG